MVLTLGQLVLYVLVVTHITIIGVTVYLHRSQAHRALDLHPALCHFFRLWLWLTTGMQTREWVAVHRKHHAHVETEQDPHSPKVFGLKQVLFRGVGLYRQAAADPNILNKYGHGTPNDWLERHVYARRNVGVLSMLVINLCLFSWQGLIIWAIQMLWIPLLAAGVINGVGHYIGYRNYEPNDWSKNIMPWGLIIGGEELHNNHHAYPRSAKLSSRAFEFDLGYFYIQCLSKLGLAKVNYVLPNIKKKGQHGLSGILNERMSIYRQYQRHVLKTVFKEGLKSELRGAFSLRRVERLLTRNRTLLRELDQKTLSFVLTLDERLACVYNFQQRLYQIFYESRGNDLLDSVKAWCREARASKQPALDEFVSWVEHRFFEGAINEPG